MLIIFILIPLQSSHSNSHHFFLSPGIINKLECIFYNNFRYFDFFEEAFNYIAYKGYIRMTGDDEKEWMDTMNNVHASVKGGMKYNTGKLLMVLYKPLVVDEGEY